MGKSKAENFIKKHWKKTAVVVGAWVLFGPRAAGWFIGLIITIDLLGKAYQHISKKGKT